MSLSFCIFMSYPEPTMCISGVGSFPVQCGSSLTIFPEVLAVGKLPLSRQTFLHVKCRHRWLFGLLTRYIKEWYVCCYIQMSICLSVCPYILSLHSYICQYICTSTSTFIHPLVKYAFLFLAYIHIRVLERPLLLSLSGCLGIPDIVGFLLQAGHFHIGCMVIHARWCVSQSSLYGQPPWGVICPLSLEVLLS